MTDRYVCGDSNNMNIKLRMQHPSGRPSPLHWCTQLSTTRANFKYREKSDIVKQFYIQCFKHATSYIYHPVHVTVHR